MNNVEKIQAAEHQVEQMQDTLESVQAGLARAEEVAVAAEEAKQRSDQAVKITLAVIGVLLVLVVFARRRSS